MQMIFLLFLVRLMGKATPSANRREPANMQTPFPARPLSAGIHRALLCSILLGPFFIAPIAIAEQAVAREYQIPQGDLGQALTRFAAEAGVVLSFDPALTRGRSTPGLQGQYEIGDGLDQLLKGSGLHSVQEGDSRYSLAPRATQSDALELGDINITSNAFGTITEQSKSYAPGTLATATRLTLTPKETPQSITVVTRQHMDDFGLNSIDKVMSHAPGVAITTYDSERTEYNVRGFSVNNFQYDGIPATRVATYSAGHTLSDMAIYDRVEILKGSTGLLTGTGTPGASFNLIRKKPTAEFQGHVSAGVGSWDNYRTELDVSGPLNEVGNVRGRAVTAYQDQHSFRERYEKQTAVYYGVLEFDLTPNTLLTLGADFQDNEPKGSSWGGNPIYDSNGNFNKRSRSFNNGTNWSSWEQYTRTVFAMLEQHFDNGWLAKIHLNHQISGYDAPLGAASGGNPNPSTGAGTRMWLARNDGETKSSAADAYMTGPFELLGREHELVLGGSLSRRHWQSDSYNAPGISTTIPDYYGWDGSIAEPNWNHSRSFEETTREHGVYATGRFSLTDDLKLILGARTSDYRGETVTKTGVTTPYAGLIYDLNPNFSLYASYTSIFSPQTLKNEQGKTLAPLEGDSYETGIKGEFFGGRLTSNLAVFEIQQDNYAIATGNRAPDGTNAYRAAQGVVVRGYELELAGELAPGWSLQGGYTHRTARRDGVDVNTIAPENQFSLFSSYTLPGHYDKLTLGGGARWQGETWATLNRPTVGTDKFSQESFWLVDLMARYQISENLSAMLNVNNVLDKKYITIMDFYSVYSWGEPRNVTASVRWDF